MYKICVLYYCTANDRNTHVLDENQPNHFREAHSIGNVSSIF